jgi:hypothetical protein
LSAFEFVVIDRDVAPTPRPHWLAAEIATDAVADGGKVDEVGLDDDHVAVVIVVAQLNAVVGAQKLAHIGIPFVCFRFWV